MTSRIARTGLSLAAVLCASLMQTVSYTAPAHAQQAAKPKAQTKSYGNWQSVCPADKSAANTPPCFARLAVVDQKRKIPLVTWTVGFNKQKQALMEVVSPVDVYIAPGLEIKLTPGPTIKLNYISCGLKGCKSRKELDKNTLQSLKAAESVAISISATNGKKINFNLKMSGSAKALSDLGL